MPDTHYIILWSDIYFFELVHGGLCMILYIPPTFLLYTRIRPLHQITYYISRACRNVPKEVTRPPKETIQKIGFSTGYSQLVVWLPIGSWYANHNSMVVWPRLTGYGGIYFICVLESDISMAAGCYHVFGGAITICAPSVGPITVNVTFQKWSFVR